MFKGFGWPHAVATTVVLVAALAGLFWGVDTHKFKCRSQQGRARSALISLHTAQRTVLDQHGRFLPLDELRKMRLWAAPAGLAHTVTMTTDGKTYAAHARMEQAGNGTRVDEWFIDTDGRLLNTTNGCIQ